MSTNNWPPPNYPGYPSPNNSPNIFARVLAAVAVLLLITGLAVLGYKAYSYLPKPMSYEERQRAEIEKGRQMKARDTERFVDLHSLQAQLEPFYDRYKYYPSLEQINDTDVRKKEFANLDGGGPFTFTDPSSKNSEMTSSLERGRYMYNAQPIGCDNVKTKCVIYVLGAYKETDPEAAYRLYSLN